MTVVAAPRAAHPYARRPEPSYTGSGSRGVPATVTVRSTHLADLMDEVRAAGLEMVESGQRIEYADRAGRRDLLMQTAARLISRGRGYAR